jgi:hypothetical protein
VSFVGVFISVPFLPPTDAYRMRPYAASIIILAALPALGFHFILKAAKLKFYADNAQPAAPFSASLVFSCILILITLTGPVVLKWTSIPVSLESVACGDGQAEYILVHFDEGTHVSIQRQSLSFLDWMPNFHTGQFRENAHSLANQKLTRWAESLEPPISLFLTLDFRTGQKVLVVLPTQTTPTRDQYYQFCGYFEADPSVSSFRIFYVDETMPLSP